MRGIVSKLERQTIYGDYIFHQYLCIEQFTALFIYGKKSHLEDMTKMEICINFVYLNCDFFPFAVNHMKLWKSPCQTAEAGSSLSDSKADHLAFVCITVCNPLTTLRYLKARTIFHRRHKDIKMHVLHVTQNISENYHGMPQESQPIGLSRFGKLFCTSVA